MSSTTKMPTLNTRGVGTIVSGCAAIAVSTLLAGGMILIMR